MNIKSLLIGSVAALAVTSGARAADAIVVAEPEPVEYVRVCDVYGSGFFYLPGTETCLRIGGYMRIDLKGGDLFARTSNEDEETYNNRARFQLRADARSETELGTLRSYAAINFNYQGGVTGGVYDNNDAWSIDHAYIELGGFRIGKTDSLFSTFTDYAAGVLNDALVPFGPYGTLQIAYTYTGPNGFSAAVALEQGDEGADDGGITEDYAPYVVGGISLKQDWGKVGVVAGYDTWEQEVAVKGRLDINIAKTASVFVMAAWDSADAGDANFYAPWGGKWAIWGGTAIKLNEKATFNAQVGYDDFEKLSVAANVAYQLVPGFTVTPEIDYVKKGDDSDQWGVNVRFQRTF